MPRGRHRHSPPLHRLLPPSAIAGVSLVCAFGPWVFSQPAVLRVIAAVAAAVALVGAAVMRRWDAYAGKQVADLTRARASDEWRFEERVAELETDLEESRELRLKMEQRLRAKRSELAGLRNEHAALLRRYATAETERASALEGRRLLEIGTAEPAKAPELLPATPKPASASAPVVEPVADEGRRSAPPAVFSPEGSPLFLRARVALTRLADRRAAETAEAEGEPEQEGRVDDGPGDVAPTAPEDTSEGEPTDKGSDTGNGNDLKAVEHRPRRDVTDGEPRKAGSPEGTATVGTVTGGAAADGTATDRAEDSRAEAAPEDEARGKAGAVDGHERVAATTSAGAGLPAQQPAGHFIAPTAVAVVPSAPARRPGVEGGFDFFGTHQEATPAELAAVQNEDLADVVGQEALAHDRTEPEAESTPADEASRDAGQVIDLTAHDETEQIDLHGLRSAVS